MSSDAADQWQTLAWLCDEKAEELPVNTLDPKGRSPIFIAARAGRVRALQLLVAKGANPAHDGRKALEQSVVADEECRMLLGTALHQWGVARGRLLLLASEAGKLSHVRALHDQRANLLYRDERGFGALHHAAAGGHEDVVLYLLQTPEAVELCQRSTGEAGALSDWSVEQLITSDKVRQHVLAFLRGDDDARRRVIQAARRKLGVRRALGGQRLTG